MPAVLITGANRGIGLEFARQYAADGWTVHATARDLEGAAELSEISGNVTVHALDVRDRKAIFRLGPVVEAPLDVVIANAGIGGRTSSGGMQTFGEFEYETFLETLEVNTLGAMAVAEAFYPHLKAGDGKKLACISSLMGSIEDTSGGAVAYRTSKAALNMALQASAAVLAANGIATTALHPGWVRTDMGGQQAPVSPSDSVTGMRAVIAGLKPQDKAQYLDYKGNTLPW